MPGCSVHDALGRIPHVVELIAGDTEPIISLVNQSETSFTTFRELDDAYKAKLEELSRPLPPVTSGQEERLSNLVTVLTALNKLLTERQGSSGIPLDQLPHEFGDMYRTPFNTFEMFQEPSLHRFLQKFPSIFQVFFDGHVWRVLSNHEAPDIVTAAIDSLSQPRLSRITVKLAPVVPLPQKTVAPNQQLNSLLAVLQNIQKKPATSTAVVNLDQPTTLESLPVLPTVSKPSGESVTSQIQALLKKKKEASNTALSGLLATMKK